jgi:hypothetical protein
MSLLCRIGWHRPRSAVTFLPSMSAKIVSAYVECVSCARCGKLLRETRHEWDGKNFITLQEKPHA